MNRTWIMASLLWLGLSCLAQSPAKMTYQAVVRHLNGQPVTETAIGMRISILQGSIDGDAIYVEVQTPVSGVHGVVTLEIGGTEASVTSGSLDSIRWEDGPFFIQTEVDPEGGDDYVIRGASQLISVPYAFHAHSSEVLTRPVSETDPLFESSPAALVDSTDIAHIKDLSGINTGDQDLSDLVSWSALQDSVREIWGDLPALPTYEIGDLAQGGVVFWVDPSGMHGLVCPLEDQSSDIRWFAGTSGWTRASGTGAFAGRSNTVLIIAAHSALGDDGSPYAARLCNELVIHQAGTPFGDWYLPSYWELLQMYLQKEVIDSVAVLNGGAAFSGEWYWSSTEATPATAAVLYFTDGTSDDFMKDNIPGVRAVRAF